MTTVEALATFASSLGAGDIPQRVMEVLRAQRASVLGAMAASLDDDASRRVVGAVLAQAADGEARVVGTSQRVRAEDAIYANAALSIALDFDDYGLFGHAGHSAVLVPLALAGESRRSSEETLVAQAVACEIALRLGGACLLGPLNGQLWSFIHAAGAALAAGRMMGLPRERLAHALAIALYQAPRPTVPGFMAPDSKLLTASDPALSGVRAARLAAAGVTGPLDALDHRQGFLSAFSYAPIPDLLLSRLGEGWAIETMSIKPYPGCAYVDTTLDAALSLDWPEPGAIERVEVDAGLLTCGMDAMSRKYATAGTPSPVTVTFSVPWNVAIAAIGRAVTPREVRSEWLATHSAELQEVARKVEVRHRWELTQQTLDAVAPLLSPRAVADRLRPGKLLSALSAMRREHSAIDVGPRDAASFLRWLATAGSARGFRFWDPEALRAFEMTFPARVRVVERGGRVHEAAASVPRGGAGHATADRTRVAFEKLGTFGPRAWGPEGTERIVRAVREDGDVASLL